MSHHVVSRRIHQMVDVIAIDFGYANAPDLFVASLHGGPATHTNLMSVLLLSYLHWVFLQGYVPDVLTVKEHGCRDDLSTSS